MPTRLRRNSINRNQIGGYVRRNGVNRLRTRTLERDSGVWKEVWRREFDVKTLPYSTDEDFFESGVGLSGNRIIDPPDTLSCNSNVVFLGNGTRSDEAAIFFGLVDVTKYNQIVMEFDASIGWDAAANDGDAYVEFGTCRYNNLSNMQIFESKILRGTIQNVETLSIDHSGSCYVFVRVYSMIDSSGDVDATAHADLLINSLVLK